MFLFLRILHKFCVIKKHIVVIGAGPAGLTAALKLSETGNRVTVLRVYTKLRGYVSNHSSVESAC